MMNDWYQRMVDTLQLNGKGERTQQAYTRSVRMLSQFYGKTPDVISEHISSLIETTCGFKSDLPYSALEPRRPITCPSCGGALRLRSLTLPSRVLLWSG